MQREGPPHVLSQNLLLARPSGLSLVTSEALPRVSDNHSEGSGDHPAGHAGILFDRYVRYVAKIGGTILGRNDEVDDVIQDVFLAVHHDLHNLRDAGSAKAWIATITVRIARQRRAERSARRRLLEIPAFELAALAAPTVSAEHTADLSGLLRVLLDLPLQFRAAWLLKHVDNLPLRRIATLCGCSESTAQRRIRTAESRLRCAGATHPLTSKQAARVSPLEPRVTRVAPIAGVPVK